MTSILNLQCQNAQGPPTHNVPSLLYVSLAYTRDIFYFDNFAWIPSRSNFFSPSLLICSALILPPIYKKCSICCLYVSSNYCCAFDALRVHSTAFVFTLLTPSSSPIRFSSSSHFLKNDLPKNNISDGRSKVTNCALRLVACHVKGQNPFEEVPATYVIGVDKKLGQGIPEALDIPLNSFHVHIY